MNQDLPSEQDSTPQNSDAINDELNESHHIDRQDDKNIQANEDLSGYQDELGTGDAEDEVQYDQGDNPKDVTLMPEGELREELDNLAMDEQEYSPEPGGNRDGAKEDDREHIEDVDEDDKR